MGLLDCYEESAAKSQASEKKGGERQARVSEPSAESAAQTLGCALAAQCSTASALPTARLSHGATELSFPSFSLLDFRPRRRAPDVHGARSRQDAKCVSVTRKSNVDVDTAFTAQVQYLLPTLHCPKFQRIPV